VLVEDHGPVAQITAEAADPSADVPMEDFLYKFARIYCHFIKKPALLAISGIAFFLFWMEGNQIRIRGCHETVVAGDEPGDDDDDSTPTDFAA